jgi:hypothetical protein
MEPPNLHAFVPSPDPDKTETASQAHDMNDRPFYSLTSHPKNEQDVVQQQPGLENHHHSGHTHTPAFDSV